MRSLLLAVLLIAAPAAAQVTPDSVRAELVRSRGFIRAAETQLTKSLALLDSLIAHGVVVDTTTSEPEPPPPDDDAPPTNPPTDTATTPTPPSPPPTGGGFRRNLPAGWTVVSDYGFDDSPPQPPFTCGPFTCYEGQPLGDGWTVLFWGAEGGHPYIQPDATAPVSPSSVLVQTYVPGLSGSGTSSVRRAFGRSDKVYLSWVVKWSHGFHHNGTSEKLIDLNEPGPPGSYAIFQFHWGAESIYDIKDPAGECCLQANQLPQRPIDRRHDAPWPSDSAYHEYEFLFDRTTGTVKWWKDGVLHASYTGRSWTAIEKIVLDTTWGGGGNHLGTDYRYTDHVTIAVGN